MVMTSSTTGTLILPSGWHHNHSTACVRLALTESSTRCQPIRLSLRPAAGPNAQSMPHGPLEPAPEGCGVRLPLHRPGATDLLTREPLAALAEHDPDQVPVLVEVAPRVPQTLVRPA